MSNNILMKPALAFFLFLQIFKIINMFQVYGSLRASETI